MLIDFAILSTGFDPQNPIHGAKPIWQRNGYIVDNDMKPTSDAISRVLRLK